MGCLPYVHGNCEDRLEDFREHMYSSTNTNTHTKKCVSNNGFEVIDGRPALPDEILAEVKIMVSNTSQLIG